MTRALRAILVLILALAALQAHVSLTRSRRFSPDSMNYVNVARNLLAGRGLAQDTLGFNQGDFTTRLAFPEPFTVQGPLFPILIAALSLLGIPAADAALLVPALAYPAILWAAFLLARRAWGERAALLALLLLVLSEPLRLISGAAWAEAPGILLLLLSVLLLLRNRVLAAGMLGGLAFADRYPLLIVLPLGVSALLLSRDGARAAAKRAGVFALGFLLVAGPVLARNLAFTGRLSGSVRNPAESGPMTHLAEAGEILFGQYLFAARGGAAFAMSSAQAALLMLSIALAVARLPAPRLGALRSLLFSDRRWILIAFPAAYSALVITVVSVVWTDLDSRLLTPALVFLLLAWAALLASAFSPAPRTLAAGVVLALIVQGAIASARLRDPPAASPRKVVRESSTLGWVRDNLRRQDLLLANNAHAVTFYLERPSVALWSYPQKRHATFAGVSSLADQACSASGGDTYILLEHSRGGGADFPASYGPFVRDLMAGRLAGYAAIEELQRFPDGRVLRLLCEGPGRS